MSFNGNFEFSGSIYCYIIKREIMNIELVKSETRGTADHGWLQSRFSFSFAEYYNPERMGFGLLRVLNDDIIAPGKGFGFHPHNNMEIISIPLKGSLEHRDSMNNSSIIQPGDIQIMSAGSGIVHSEFNPSSDEPGNFLQIWIQPKIRNINPRYQQLNFDCEHYDDNLLTVVSPDGSHSALFINQDAYIAIGKYKSERKETYSIQKNGNGVFLFVVDGKVDINGIIAGKRDALQITDCGSFEFMVAENSCLVIIEIPMQ